MLIKNSDYEILITDLGSEGQGIGKIDDIIVFVEGGLPEDKILIKIIKAKTNYAVGKILKVLIPSKYRIKSPCPVYLKCGGCQFQNYNYQKELEYKQNKVYNNLLRIGKIDTKVDNIIESKNILRYRNKAQFPVKFNSNSEIEIGFFRKHSHDIVEIKDCMIQSEINKEITSIIKKFMEKINIIPYNEISHTGLIRHIVTRVSLKTNEVMICIVINGNDLPKKKVLIDMLLEKITNLKSVVLNINKEKNNVILSPKLKTIYGDGYIYDFIGNIKYKISPLSFFQVNPTQTKILYDIVLKFANLTGNEVVFDAYCGIGSISLYIASKAKKVYGIEIVDEAINDAIDNAEINNIDNVEFIIGKSEEIVPSLYNDKKIIPDIIIIDPPRKGCENDFLNSMLEIEPKKIIYVSCEPSTLSRDLKVLCENKYKINKVQPVDCFSRTFHVETIVLLERVNND